MEIAGNLGFNPLKGEGTSINGKTSSSKANGPGAADSSPNAAPPPVTAISPGDSNTPVKGGSYIAGAISLNMHFELNQKYSVTKTRQTADGYMELRQSLERRFSADYSFNFAFISSLDGTAQKLGSFDTDVLNEFVNAASDLITLSEEDLLEFTQAVDKLFGELKKAVGGQWDFLDGTKELLKNSVSSFIHMVRQEMETLKEPGQPGDIPRGIDYESLRGETMKKFDDDFFLFLQELMEEYSDLLNDQQRLLMETLLNFRENPQPAKNA